MGRDDNMWVLYEETTAYTIGLNWYRSGNQFVIRFTEMRMKHKSENFHFGNIKATDYTLVNIFMMIKSEGWHGRTM
jgi:hypothetical protein